MVGGTGFEPVTLPMDRDALPLPFNELSDHVGRFPGFDFSLVGEGVGFVLKTSFINEFPWPSVSGGWGLALSVLVQPTL